MTLPVLRRLVEPAVLQDLWRRTFAANVVGERGCPACRRSMLEVAATAVGEPVPLDVCPRCHLVWFDDREYEQMPARAQPPPPERPPVGRSRGTTGGSSRPGDQGVTGLRLLPAILGMPVELHDVELHARPIGTWLIAAIVAATSIFAFVEPQWIERLALVPDELWRFGGLSMLTAFFVHGSVWHLVGNLYFFVTFGDNVEDYLGRRRWLLLVGGATLAGALLHVLGDPNSQVPCVGASGGISGLIAFYALRFPRARLGSFLWFLLLPHWITYPAWGGFLFWMLSQAVLLWQQLLGVGSVSALAHLGGALVGVLAWWRWRDV